MTVSFFSIGNYSKRFSVVIPVVQISGIVFTTVVINKTCHYEILPTYGTAEAASRYYLHHNCANYPCISLSSNALTEYQSLYIIFLKCGT